MRPRPLASAAIPRPFASRSSSRAVPGGAEGPGHVYCWLRPAGSTQRQKAIAGTMARGDRDAYGGITVKQPPTHPRSPRRKAARAPPPWREDDLQAPARCPDKSPLLSPEAWQRYHTAKVCTRPAWSSQTQRQTARGSVQQTERRDTVTCSTGLKRRLRFQLN